MSTNEMYRQMLTNAVSGSALMGGCCGSALMGGAVKLDGDIVKLPNPNYQPKKIKGIDNPKHQPKMINGIPNPRYQNRYIPTVKGSPEYSDYINSAKYQSMLVQRKIASRVTRASNKLSYDEALANALVYENRKREENKQKPLKHLPKYKKCEIRCREAQINDYLRKEARSQRLTDEKADAYIYGLDKRASLHEQFNEGFIGREPREAGYKLTEEEKKRRKATRAINEERKHNEDLKGKKTDTP